nr:hypothetical protein [uncultured Sphingomonas sp.]
MGKRSAGREMTMEEYEAWSAAYKLSEKVKETANEVGGPQLSLVPIPTAMKPGPEPDNLDHPANFEPEPSRNRHGWSALRQRVFILTLAETGSVHVAAKEALMSARGAYALRVRSGAFRLAWDTAQQLAVGRLSALAFDRAINGRPEQIYEGGELVGERRVPNDRLLMWLLARLDPKRFAMPWEQRGDAGDPQADASSAIAGHLDGLEDTEPFDVLSLDGPVTPDAAPEPLAKPKPEQAPRP